MMTTKNLYGEEPAPQHPEPDHIRMAKPVQRKDLDAVLKLQDVQKMFLPGSDAWNKVQDIINDLSK